MKAVSLLLCLLALFSLVASSDWDGGVYCPTLSEYSPSVRTILKEGDEESDEEDEDDGNEGPDENDGPYFPLTSCDPHDPSNEHNFRAFQRSDFCKRPGVRGRFVWGFQIDGFSCINNPGPRVYLMDLQLSYCFRPWFCGDRQDVKSIEWQPKWVWRDWAIHKSGDMKVSEEGTGVSFDNLDALNITFDDEYPSCYFHKQPKSFKEPDVDHGVTGNPELSLIISEDMNVLGNPIPLGKCVKVADEISYLGPPLFTIFSPLDNYYDFYFDFECKKNGGVEGYQDPSLITWENGHCAGPKNYRRTNSPHGGAGWLQFLAEMEWNIPGGYDDPFEYVESQLNRYAFTIRASGGNGNHVNNGTIDDAGTVFYENAEEEYEFDFGIEIGNPFPFIKRPNPCLNTQEITGTTSNPNICSSLKVNYKDASYDETFGYGTCQHPWEYTGDICPQDDPESDGLFADTQGDFNTKTPSTGAFESQDNFLLAKPTYNNA